MKRPTDAVLKEAMSLEEMIRSATRRLEEIRAQAKACGSFATKDFVVAVSEQSRTSLAGLADVKAAVGEAILIKNDLIKTHTYQTVKIVRKVAA